MSHLLTLVRGMADSHALSWLLGTYRDPFWPLVVGLLFLASGVGQIWPPGAQIVPGAVLVALALGFNLTRSKREGV
jgi:hypothetical protein